MLAKALTVVLAGGLVGASGVAGPAAAVAAPPVSASVRAAQPVKTDLVGWGDNRGGQLGQSWSQDFTATPRPIFGVSGVVANLSANGEDPTMGVSFVRTTQGDLWSFGFGSFGQAGIGPGSGSFPLQVGLSKVRQVAAGGNFTLALLEDGRVFSWGDNTSGELGAAGTGRDRPAVVPGVTGVTQIAAGGDTAYALRSDGTVLAWGLNNLGQLGTGSTTPASRTKPAPVPGLTGVTQIAAGSRSAVAVLGNGTVKAWGGNANQVLGVGSTASSVNVPTLVKNLTGVTRLAIGGGITGGHTLALLGNGTVKAWGSNGSGQIGIGTVGADQPTPVAVPGLTNVAEIGTGFGYSVVRLTDGTVRTWGLNDRGQLGIGSVNNQSRPTLVPTVRYASAIAVGLNHTLVATKAPQFELRMSPSPLTIPIGGRASVKATLVPYNGYTGQAAIVATSIPSGVTAALSASTITAAKPVTLDIRVAANATPAHTGIDLQGLDSNSPVPVVSSYLPLSLAPPSNFAVFLEPKTVWTLYKGNTVTTSIYMLGFNGVTGPVHLVATGPGTVKLSADTIRPGELVTLSVRPAGLGTTDVTYVRAYLDKPTDPTAQLLSFTVTYSWGAPT
jgi:alpha-tubulin suppressor-like RCC1 family protein